MKRITGVLFSVLLLWGCSDRGSGGGIEADPPGNNHKGVFICNEGNYTYGNATLSFYDTEHDAVTEPLPLYHNGYLFPLGDVCQSMYIRGDWGFIVVNNSSKIYIIDVNTNAYVGGITGLTSPRYVEFISDTKAYVSDLYNPSMIVINPTTLEKTGSLRVGRGTEQMVRYGTTVFACSWSYGDQIYKIDTQTDRTVDSLTVTLQPNSMVLDRDGKLWVLSDGGYAGSPHGQQMPALTRIDAATFTIEKMFPLGDMNCAPSELTINGDKDRIYFLNSGTSENRDGVYTLDVAAGALPGEPLIAEGDGELFYALGVDPSNGDIYVSDAIDYTQKGIVSRYNDSGGLVKRFKAGIIPGAFCFRTQ